MKDIDDVMDDLVRIAGVKKSNGNNLDSHTNSESYGLLEALVKNSKKEEPKQYNKEDVNEYVPNVMQGTPAESLIMELGGGTSRAELGLPSKNNGKTPVVKVPGIDEETNNPVTDPNDLKDIKRAISYLASFFGGKVTWK